MSNKKSCNLSKTARIAILLVLVITALWQYFETKKVLVKDLRPMSIDIKSVDNLETNVALKIREAKQVYVGTNPKLLNVTSVKTDSENPKRLILTVTGQGKTYPDSNFFEGERLVYGEKVKVHSIYDFTGVVANIEYLK
jgi:predicted metalloendopeptidase